MPVKQERIVIEDFRPGIFADWHGSATGSGSSAGIRNAQNGSATTQNGAAVVEGTSRCCADQSGALAPLPRVSLARVTTTMPGGNANVGTRFPASHPYIYLLDAMVASHFNFQGTGSLGSTDGRVRDTLALCYGFYYQDPAAAPVRVRYYQRATFYRLFTTLTGGSDYQSDFWFGLNDNPAWSTQQAELGAANLFLLRSTHNSFPNDTFTHLAFAISVIQEAYAGAVQGYEANISDYGVYNAGNPRPKEIGIYGDYAQGLTNESNFVSAPVSRAVLACSHQGRITAVYTSWLFNGVNDVQITPLNANANANDYLSQYDRIEYTPFLDPLNLRVTMPAAGIRTNSFGDDNADLTGAIASLGNDELLMIRHRGGGVLVSGDLDNPTVRRLPFITSMNGAKCHPALSPLGLVYGTADGVFVWEGGETSRKLSTQIDGGFWRLSPSVNAFPPPTQDGQPVGNVFYQGSEGRFCWWDPWLLAPNNWLYDPRHESWWRLDEPADATNGKPYGFSVYAVNPSSNSLYVFPWRLSATKNVAAYEVQREFLAQSFKWKSQPLVESLDRVLTLSDARIVVTTSPENPNASSVTLVISGFDKNGAPITPVTVSFTGLASGANSGRPVIRSRKFPNIQGSHFQVAVTANSGGTYAAPKIHHISFGYRESPSNALDS